MFRLFFLASLVPLGQGPLEFLRRIQQPDGCWTGYWWKSPVYATVHAAEALNHHGTAADGARVARAVRWAEACLGTSPHPPDAGESPFDTALALRLLLLAPTKPLDLIATTTRWLLAAQLADGSWAASAQLAVRNSHGREVPALDGRRIFTTATVLRTLLRLSPESRVPAGDTAKA